MMASGVPANSMSHKGLSDPKVRTCSLQPDWRWMDLMISPLWPMMWPIICSYKEGSTDAFESIDTERVKLPIDRYVNQNDDKWLIDRYSN